MDPLQLEKKTIVSFTQARPKQGFGDNDSGVYVFDVSLSCDSSVAVASLSDQNLMTFDVVTHSVMNRVKAHSSTINCFEMSKCSPNIAFTASTDKTACMLDLRLNGNAAVISRIRHDDDVTAVSVGLSDTLLATGCGSVISFYDIRMITSSGSGSTPSSNSSSSSSSSTGAATGTTTKKLGEYADLHTDIVTQLRFSMLNPAVLASGSEDGLICIYDTAASSSDSAVQSILNTECPVRRIGFFGGSEEALYCLSSVETASFWHIPSAQRVGHFSTLRESLGVDYLVDCLYDVECDTLMMVAGDYSGKGLLAVVEPTRVQPFASFGSSEIATAPSSSSSSISAAATNGSTARAAGGGGGHSAMLRCAVKFGSSDSSSSSSVITLPNGSRVNSARIITGGEDASICAWRLGNPPVLAASSSSIFATGATADVTANSSSSSSNLSVHQQQKKRHERRDRPY